VKVIGNLTKDAIIRAAVSEGLTIPQSVGSGVVYEQANASSTSVVYDTANDKIVVGYRDGGDSNYGKAVVGTVSGDSISFGSPVTFYNTSAINALQTVFDTNSGKIVFVFEGNSGYGIAMVGTVSGTSISFGSTTDFLTAQVGHIGLAYDSTNSKVVVCCRNGGNSNRGNARVGTVSGTSISFGTDVTYNSGGNTTENEIVYDTNAQKMVIAFRDIANSSYGTAIVGTVSGTDISFGSEVVFNSANSNSMGISYDPIAQKVLIAYMDEGNNYYGTAIVGTVSGTSISFGSSAVYAANSTGSSQIAYDANAQRHVIVYRNQTTSPYSGFLIPATVSGTSVSFGTATSFTSTSFAEPDVAYDADQKKVVLAYSDANNSYYGTARVFTTGYSQATGGTIADGKAVILNSNGTVSTISQTAASLGTKSAFNSSTSSFFASVFDSSNNKHIITYRQGNTIRYVVATVASDGSVSYGTDAQAVAGDYSQLRACFDSTNNRIVMVFKNGANYAMVGSLSGTTVTWGSVTQFDSASSGELDIDFDSTAGKVVIAYKDGNNSNYGTAIIGTVSGTSISFGTPVVYESATAQRNTVIYDSTNNKTVIGFRDDNDSNKGKAVVGTVSGTSISFGSTAVFHTGEASRITGAFDSTNSKIVFTFNDSSNNQYPTAVVGTVSGTSISFGSAVVIDSAGTYGEKPSAVFDTNSNKIITVYLHTVDGSFSNYGHVSAGGVSGTSISFDTKVAFNSAATVYPDITFDSNVNKNLIAFGDGGNSEYASTMTFSPLSGNLTTENFVGFMDGAALDGTNGEILSSCSIARNQTSLTAGQTYFVTPTGTLSTSAGSPSVTAGTAISSTELIVKG